MAKRLERPWIRPRVSLNKRTLIECMFCFYENLEKYILPNSLEKSSLKNKTFVCVTLPTGIELNRTYTEEVFICLNNSHIWFATPKSFPNILLAQSYITALGI